jgi:nicotinate-nucleotide adenylyltransferase
MRLGVLGGTFDPVHVGHLILAQCALEQLGLEQVRFLPAGDPWRKHGRPVTEARRRLRMVELAVADNPLFEVDPLEVETPGPSYTSESLAKIAATLPQGSELFFVLGEDALADLPNWHEPEVIVRHARLAVAGRGEIAAPVPAYARDRMVRVEMPAIDVSSTELRRRVREGLTLRYYAPPAVEAYVREQGLYRD